MVLSDVINYFDLALLIFYENTLICYLKSSFLDMSCIIWLQVVAVVYLTVTDNQSNGFGLS